MIYEYECERCNRHFDVAKSVRDMDSPETCKCGGNAHYVFVPSRVLFSGEKVQEAEYNPGLGCITKNKKHRDEIARQKGVVEVGNETPESLHKMHDAERERRREKAWEESTKGWVGSDG